MKQCYHISSDKLQSNLVVDFIEVKKSDSHITLYNKYNLLSRFIDSLNLLRCVYIGRVSVVNQPTF